MLVDFILDRKDDEQDGFDNYHPENLTDYVSHFDDSNYQDVLQAVNNRDEKATKLALIKYIIDGNYNPQICKYIMNVSWVDGFKFW